MRVFVTGGQGFIGSAVIRQLLARGDQVLNLDKMTYAGGKQNVETPIGINYRFVQGDIRDQDLVGSLLSSFRPDVVMHLAAESHVDRSLDSAFEFVQTNIVGTYALLEATLAYWRAQNEPEQFLFFHISTDEVFGSLPDTGFFNATSRYDPRSPYSATKASSDHLVRAWHHSFGLPIVVTNCSNNYGPYQYPEKLIPVAIIRALHNKAIPLYGDGKHIRDWLYVEDHAAALLQILDQRNREDTYLIGGYGETSNAEILNKLCQVLDEEHPTHRPYGNLIAMVKDRPGHDRRYAIDPADSAAKLNWTPKVSLDEGLRKTVRWYLQNEDWWKSRLRNENPERMGLAG